MARSCEAGGVLAQTRAKAASEAADRRITASAVDSAEAAVRRIGQDKARVDAEVASLGDSAALAATHSESVKAAEAAEAAIAAAETSLQNAEADRSEEHTSELQSLMRISYAVFCLNKKTPHQNTTKINPTLTRN